MLHLKTSVKPIKVGKYRNTSIRFDPPEEKIANVLGLNDQGAPVFFTEKERRNHTHLIGATQQGKSKFLELLLRHDIENKNAGLCLLDPHGTLYNDMLLYIAFHKPRLAEKVILFNPAGKDDHIVGFNPINYEKNPEYATSLLIEACLKAWGQQVVLKTPRIRDWLFNFIFPLVVNRLTLLEALPFLHLQSVSQRRALLQDVSNDMVTYAWEEFECLPNQKKRDMIEGAGNRLKAFLQDPTIRKVIGQKNNVLNFSKIMEEGKILLINLHGQGKISQANTKLLGTLLINEIFKAAELRNAGDKNLKPFYCYIDEFGQFVTDDVAHSLDQTAKFKLFYILAHQHIPQLETEDDQLLLSSVLTNCKNKVVFGGLTKRDVEIMSDETIGSHLNLKTVKDEIYATKFRPIEETRETVSRGKSLSNSKNMAKTKTKSILESEAKSVGENFSRTTTDTEGTIETNGWSESNGQANVDSWATSDSNAIAKGETRLEGSSEIESRGDSQSSGSSQGSGTQRGTTVTSNFKRGEFIGNSQSNFRGYSNFSGSNESNSSFRSQGKGKQKSFSKSKVKTRSHTETGGGARINSRQTGTHGSLGKSEARSIANQEGFTKSEINAKGEVNTEGIANSEGSTKTDSKIVSTAPYDRKEEFKELSSRTYWSKDELLKLEQDKIKNQNVGCALIKTPARPPTYAKIKYVEDTAWTLERLAEKRISKLKDDVVRLNSDCYSNLLEIREEYTERQVDFFEKRGSKPIHYYQTVLVEDRLDFEDEEGRINPPTPFNDD